jgi:hypothetical protein
VIHKRRNPLVGPLVTIGFMIGSAAAIGALAHFVDLHSTAQPEGLIPSEVTIRAGAILRAGATQ